MAWEERNDRRPMEDMEVDEDAADVPTVPSVLPAGNKRHRSPSEKVEAFARRLVAPRAAATEAPDGV